MPFAEQLDKFTAQWARPQRRLENLADQSGDGGKLLRTSFNVLLAHEDKRYPGALIASMSIPWGEAKGDEDTGGYHLVWPRDMVNSATGLMAAGQSETAYRALIYLAASQNPNGSFAQNFWINGTPYFRSLQLDEVAFPILLARQLTARRFAGRLRSDVFGHTRGAFSGAQRAGYAAGTLGRSERTCRLRLWLRLSLL